MSRCTDTPEELTWPGVADIDKWKLESAHHSAVYWLNGAREIEDRNEAVLCAEQAVNAWKNAAVRFAQLANRVSASSETRRIPESTQDESIDAAVDAAQSSAKSAPSEALKLAEQWKGRADDAGRLSRAVIGSAPITAEQLSEVKSQCESGLLTDHLHQCPATFALSAIYADLFLEDR